MIVLLKMQRYSFIVQETELREIDINNTSKQSRHMWVKYELEDLLFLRILSIQQPLSKCCYAEAVVIFPFLRVSLYLKEYCETKTHIIFNFFISHFWGRAHKPQSPAEVGGQFCRVCSLLPTLHRF